MIQPATYDAFQEVYLIQEKMDADLHRVIRAQHLSNEHVQFFLYQLLRGLKHLHSIGYICPDGN
jgi:mitogen-activated protein kinase 1/3